MHATQINTTWKIEIIVRKIRDENYKHFVNSFVAKC